DSGTAAQAGTEAVNDVDMKKITSALKYVEAIRRYGHTEADIYPVGGYKGEGDKFLDSSTYDLTDEDVKAIAAKWLWDKAPAGVDNGLEVIERLKKYYT